MTTSDLHQVVADLAGAAADQDRNDLAGRLESEVRRDDTGEPTLVVIGAVSRGKSSLVNALVGAPLLPVDPDVATRSYVTITHSDTSFISPVSGGSRREGVTAEAVRETLEAALDEESAFEVGWPEPSFGRGLRIVDTPGLGGLSAAHDALTRAALLSADAVMFVLDASSPMSRTEMDLMREASSRVATVLVVMTKVDSVPQWREVLAESQEHLRRLGPEMNAVSVLPVSSSLHEQAQRMLEAGKEPVAEKLREQAGIVALGDEIVAKVVGQAEELSDRNLIRICRYVLGALRALDEVVADTDAVEVDAEIDSLRTKLRDLADLRTQALKEIHEQIVALSADLAIEIGAKTMHVSFGVQSQLDSGETDQESLQDDMDSALGEAAVELTMWIKERVDVMASEMLSQVDHKGELPSIEIGTSWDGFKLPTADPRATVNKAQPATHVLDAREHFMGVAMFAGQGSTIGTLLCPGPGTAIGAAAGGLIGLGSTLVGRKERTRKAEHQADVSLAKAYAGQVIQQVMALQVRTSLDKLVAQAQEILNSVASGLLDMRKNQAESMLANLKQAQSESEQQRAARRTAAKARIDALNRIGTRLGAAEKAMGVPQAAARISGELLSDER
jgi:signal recognition particle receptor subunit beta